MPVLYRRGLMESTRVTMISPDYISSQPRPAPPILLTRTGSLSWQRAFVSMEFSSPFPSGARAVGAMSSLPGSAGCGPP